MSDLGISTLANLKTRAQAAYKLDLGFRKQAEDEIYESIHCELVDFLIHVLQIDDGTAYASMHRANNTSTQASAHQKDDPPSAPRRNLAVEVVVEDVKLRGRFVPAHVGTVESGSDGKIPIWQDEFQVELRTRTGQYTQIKSLSDLGAAL